jgi:hypothetical protein
MPEEFMDRELRDAELGRAYVATATPADLPREVDVLENGTVTVRDCISTVLEEEFEHHRRAVRDLATFE